MNDVEQCEKSLDNVLETFRRLYSNEDCAYFYKVLQSYKAETSEPDHSEQDRILLVRNSLEYLKKAIDETQLIGTSASSPLCVFKGKKS